jgi:hypothetical protein
LWLELVGYERDVMLNEGIFRRTLSRLSDGTAAGIQIDSLAAFRVSITKLIERLS